MLKEYGIFEKLITVSRTTKVVKGGRRFRFSALVVTGDRNGKLGVGRGKARDIVSAIQKAVKKARKECVQLDFQSLLTIPCALTYKYGATKVIMIPTRQGTGIVAGSVMRAVFDVIGIKNVCTKVVGSRNTNTVVLAMLMCFKKMRLIKKTIGFVS